MDLPALRTIPFFLHRNGLAGLHESPCWHRNGLAARTAYWPTVSVACLRLARALLEAFLEAFFATMRYIN